MPTPPADPSPPPAEAAEAVEAIGASAATGPVAPAARAWPPVSVIMPVLNEERHLRTAVRHVLEQGYPGELELVLALGPSRDRTDAIAEALAAADPRVRTVR
ncbi:glycosyltransferase, partial [Motilibacter deserti]